MIFDISKEQFVKLGGIIQVHYNWKDNTIDLYRNNTGVFYRHVIHKPDIPEDATEEEWAQYDKDWFDFKFQMNQHFNMSFSMSMQYVFVENVSTISDKLLKRQDTKLYLLNNKLDNLLLLVKELAEMGDNDAKQ